MKSRWFLALALAGSLVACDDDPVDPGLDGGDGIDAGSDVDSGAADAGHDAGPTEPGPECTQTITPNAGGATWVQLCALDGPVRHVKIEGVTATATHASAQFFLGFDAQPAGSQAPLAADQWKLMLYGGGTPAPSPAIQAVFGTNAMTMDGSHGFINTTSTICFDVLDGSASSAPVAIVWVDGANGADCDAPLTLTTETAQGITPWYRGALGAISKDERAWYYQSAGATATPTITMSTTAVVDAAAIEAASRCSTNWQQANGVDRVQLCRPDAGYGRHYTIDNAASTTNNKYFYLIVGEPLSVTAAPTTAAADGRFVFTGGRSSSAASWTYFRFNGTSSTQYEFAAGTPASPLYTAQPNTVCLDLGRQDAPNAANLRVYFWATGSNGADCADRATLTAATAIYDSTADAAANYAAAIATDQYDFVKMSGSDPTTTATVGAVTVSTIPAVY